MTEEKICIIFCFCAMILFDVVCYLFSIATLLPNILEANNNKKTAFILACSLSAGFALGFWMASFYYFCKYRRHYDDGTRLNDNRFLWFNTPQIVFFGWIFFLFIIPTPIVLVLIRATYLLGVMEKSPVLDFF